MEVASGTLRAESASEAPAHNTGKPPRRRFLLVHELIGKYQFLRDNQYILSGYRPMMRVSEIMKSIFSLHNETVNIWSHLLGALGMLCILVYIVASGHFLLDLGDSARCYPFSLQWPLVFYLLSAFLCLSFSGLYHLLFVHSPSTSQTFQLLDYLGITILFAGSCIPALVFLYYTHPTTLALILSAVVLFSALVVYWTLSLSRIDQQRYVFRTLLFMSYGLLILSPLFTSVLLADMNHEIWKSFIVSFVWVLAIYCLGAVFYVARIPEKWFPGKFDILFSSHQLFHICIVVASYLQFEALEIIFQWRLVTNLVLSDSTLNLFL